MTRRHFKLISLSVTISTLTVILISSCGNDKHQPLRPLAAVSGKSGAGAGGGCVPPEEIKVSFQEIYSSIITKKDCFMCHTAANKSGGMDLTTDAKTAYSYLVNQPAKAEGADFKGLRVVPGNFRDSYLWIKLTTKTGKAGQMPASGRFIDKDPKLMGMVEEWITDCAPFDKTGTTPPTPTPTPAPAPAPAPVPVPVPVPDTPDDGDNDSNCHPDKPTGTSVTFGQIQEIFNDRCIECHAVGGYAAGVMILTADQAYESLKKKAMMSGNVVNRVTPSKSSAKESYLVAKIIKDGTARGGGNRMPLSSLAKPKKPLTDAQIQMIKDWIDQGAKND